jgi:membrane-associated phospholipid phosphatase
MDARSDWALARGLALLGDRLRSEFGRVPRTTWRRAAVWLAGGLALVLVLTTLVTLWARAADPDWLLARDTRWLLQVAEGPISFQAAIFWQTLGASSLLIPALALAAGLALWARRPLRAAALLLGFLGTKVIALLGWTIWDRARPELIADGLASPPLHSFPSGHAIQVVTFFGLLAYFWIAASRSRVEQALAVVSVVVLDLLVGVARVRLGTHWPSDVVAGSLLGAAWLAVLVAVLRRAERAGSTGLPPS